MASTQAQMDRWLSSVQDLSTRQGRNVLEFQFKDWGKLLGVAHADAGS